MGSYISSLLLVGMPYISLCVLTLCVQFVANFAALFCTSR